MTITMSRYAVYEIHQAVLQAADHQMVYDVRDERRRARGTFVMTAFGH
jgi:hypothetical protein